MPQHPVFHWHLLPSQTTDVQRAGVLDRASFEITDDGLYGEAILDANRAAEQVMALITANDGAWSTGALPQRVKVRQDGYVEEWPLVEASVATRAGVVSQPGSTNAYLRGLIPGYEGVDIEATRSYWVMNGNVFPPPAAAAPVAPPVTAPTPGAPGASAAPVGVTAEQIREIIQQEMAAQPTRALPVGQEQLHPQVQIQVRSQYDSCSLQGMLLLDQVRTLAHRKGYNGYTYSRSEEFMRALVDKARVVSEAEDKQYAGTILPDYHLQVRAMDTVAYDVMHKRVPYLRATEAMNSTLVGFGDEWVPTLLTSATHLGYRLETKIYRLLDVINPPSNPFTMPTMISGPQPRRVVETVDQAQMSIPGSPYPVNKVGTSGVTFQSRGKLGVIVALTDELIRDSGPMIADAAAERLNKEMAKWVDWVLLNGHIDSTTGNISHNGANPGGTIYDSVFLVTGLRQMAYLDGTSATVATVDRNYVTVMQRRLGPRGRFGVNPDEVVAVVDPGTYFKMLDVTEYQGVQNIGDKAVNLQGVLQEFRGVRLVISDELENVDATTGYVPQTHNGTQGQSVAFNRRLLKVASWRDIQIKSWEVEEADTFVIKASTSLDVQKLEAGAVAHNTRTVII